MRIQNSLKSMGERYSENRLVRHESSAYIMNKTRKRNKARQRLSHL